MYILLTYTCICYTIGVEKNIKENKKYSSARERQLPCTQQVIPAPTSGIIRAAYVSIQSIIVIFNGSALFLHSQRHRTCLSAV